jgi:ribosomal protein S6
VKTYEITYLTLNEEGSDAGTIATTLANHNARIVAVHPWGGRRKLTFPIKKEEQAFFTTVVFEAETSVIAPLERAFQLNTAIMRSLIVAYQPGLFDRGATEEATPKAASPEVKTETPVTEPVKEEQAATPEVATEEAKTETPAPAEAKPKRKRAPKKTEEEQKELDKKLDELLNEDLTK